jgi:hypothetical protein
MYVIKGHKTKAVYRGLEEKKVAVICNTDAKSYGPDALTDTLNNTIGLKLKQNVRKIEIIPSSTIKAWLDSNDWDQANYAALGKGVGADMIVAVDVGSYTIHEGLTLYKGQADLTISVYNVAEGGKVEFSKGPERYEFPKSGRPATQTNDRQFEAVYLAKVTDTVSKLFYDHDALDNVADDATYLNY